MKNGGGHFAPKLGGHFELESGGHFKLELGGQYHWNLHYCNKSLYDELFSNKSDWLDFNVKLNSWESLSGQKETFITCVFSESKKKINSIM